jgi:predicted RNA-binding protein with PUA-like domain
MKAGERCLFYHSVDEKAVVGVAEVVKAAYPDPTAADGDWSMVDVAPVFGLKKPVTLEMVKAVPALVDMVLVNNTRLSVQPVARAEFDAIVKMGGKAAI